MKKGARLALVLLLVAAGGALAYAGAQPEGFKGVAQIANDPAAFEGREVEVKGSVAPGSLARGAEAVTFALEEEGARLLVHWDAAVPIPDAEAGGSIEGKNVVVHGTIVLENGVPVLHAHEMSVGCPSKYRAE